MGGEAEGCGGGARPLPPQQRQTLSQTASVPLVTIRTPEPEAKNCALLLWALFFTAFNKNNLIYHCIKCLFTLSQSSSNPVCGFSFQTSSLQNHTCGKVPGAASPSSRRGWQCSGPSGSALPGFPSLSPKAPAVPSAAPGLPLLLCLCRSRRALPCRFPAPSFAPCLSVPEALFSSRLFNLMIFKFKPLRNCI